MSSEVCPFCGKLYKRLKSHLPHCKAAPSVKDPSGQHDAAANQTTAAEFPRQKTKETLKLGTKSTSSSLLTTSSNSSTKKKKKQTLDEQIITSTLTLPKPASKTVSKPKKKGLRDLIEAAKSKQGAENLLENDRDKSKSTFTDSHLSSKTGTKAEKDSVKSAPKKKLKKKALESERTQENKQQAPKRCNVWEEDAEDVHEGGVHVQQGRISLQSVRATLGRANVTQQPSNSPSILSQLKTTNGFHGNIPPPQTETSQPPQSKQTSLKTSFHAIPQRHVTGNMTTSPPLSQSSSYPHLPVTLQTLPVDVEQLLSQRHTEGALAQRSLGEVKLRELPDWLACKSPSHPREIVAMVQRGWQWYYRKYFYVKKGGVAGVSMLLAGYCTLSYIWSYPRIKLDRWRKYH
ncbi:uncharacterized protein si:dkey-21c1.4 isoform X2 [Gouania willdenowi]|uniref:uncharacterized protein si:dkey-21c1.4 isoform X2 n=1 Tax=Gouania willdenowi TaxID=441366 RepID=UPI00105472FA|nr:uncharacterized protein C17orf80 homolog isoform X2 [Gouania willdenowi]